MIELSAHARRTSRWKRIPPYFYSLGFHGKYDYFEVKKKTRISADQPRTMAAISKRPCSLHHLAIIRMSSRQLDQLRCSSQAISYIPYLSGTARVVRVRGFAIEAPHGRAVWLFPGKLLLGRAAEQAACRWRFLRKAPLNCRVQPF